MFVQESKKVFPNACFQRFGIGWVKPYNIAFSIFPNVFNIFNIYNSLKKENCPMRGAYLIENILYYDRISFDDETYKPKLYKGICETTSKKRYANHKKSFNVEKNKNDTKLSTEY